jgi:hypothetical protein
MNMSLLNSAVGTNSIIIFLCLYVLGLQLRLNLGRFPSMLDIWRLANAMVTICPENPVAAAEAARKAARRRGDRLDKGKWLLVRLYLEHKLCSSKT